MTPTPARDRSEDDAAALKAEARDARETQQAIEGEGARCLLIPGDVRSSAVCRRAVERTVDDLGRLDVLVNNAAFQQHQTSIEDLSDAQIERTFRTNIFGYFYKWRAPRCPHMKPGGAIINCGSITGLPLSRPLPFAFQPRAGRDMAGRRPSRTGKKTKSSTRKKAPRKAPTTKKRAPKPKRAAATKPAPSRPVSKKKPAFNPKTDSANDPHWVAPVWDDELLLGAHVSIAGGTHEAPPRARAIGATAMQLFTKMANRWADRMCETDECSTFAAAIAMTRVRATIAHDSYLINLASPDATLRRRSIESFAAELQRCEALGITYLVSHPGNYIDDRASGIARNADAIVEALARVPGRTILCLETTAGSGTAIGAAFEDLARLIELIPEPHRTRLGICLDTCHAYSAGYDLVNAYDDVWRRFDDLIGLERLRVMHLNDSKTPFDSRRDRHELIGEGSIGERGFRHVMNDPRLVAIPKVIETPKGTDPTATDARMLARLRSYVARG